MCVCVCLYARRTHTLPAHLSKTQPTMFFVCQHATDRHHREQLSHVYAWVLRHRNQYAHRYPCLENIRPKPNESNMTPDEIGAWCDSQIDAFSLFRCKQLLARGSRKRAQSHHGRLLPPG